MTIEDIVKAFPDANFTIRASDLITFGERLVMETMARAREDEAVNTKDALITAEEAQELFGVTSTTLWRWRKRGYLEGVSVGGRIKYRRSDCISVIKNK